MRILYREWQQHWKNERYQQNSHKWQTWDLRWQLGFQWHRRGIELVLQVPRLFHNATVSQYDHFFAAIYVHVFVVWNFTRLITRLESFYYLNLVGGTQLQYIYYLCPILISRPPRVFRRFKRRSCYGLLSAKFQTDSSRLFRCLLINSYQ